MPSLTATERSGQLRVRLPVELHAALANEAERQGVSLNTLIIALLAGGINWGQPRAKQGTRPPKGEPPKGRP